MRDQVQYLLRQTGTLFVTYTHACERMHNTICRAPSIVSPAYHLRSRPRHIAGLLLSTQHHYGMHDYSMLEIFVAL